MQSPNQAQSNGSGTNSLAEVLLQESERLRQLAEACKKREEYEAEMRANYPYFKRFVYDALRKEFLSEVPELPEDVDLLAYIEKEGGLPLEAFIDEFERGPKGNP